MRFSFATLFAGILLLSAHTAEAAGNLTIMVDSKPSGASFAIYGQNSTKLEGTTPAVFTNQDSFEYRIVYEKKDGCSTPAPQRRSPSTAVLHFVGTYDCTTKVQASSSSSSASSVSVPVAARIAHTVNQTEAVAGSDIMVTIAVRNLTKGTLNNVVVTEQFDPTKASVARTLPENGTFNGTVALWTIPQIFAGQSWSVTFPLRVAQTLRTGESITLTARMSGDNLSSTSAGTELTNTLIVGVPPLPQTGSFMIAFALAVIGGVSLFLTFTIRRRKLVA